MKLISRAKLHQCPKCGKSFLERDYNQHIKSCGRIKKDANSAVDNSSFARS
jgi:uncharacterized C2H2 Zn-finger protein